MAFRTNSVVIGGNLTAQPELKQTANGFSVCNFTVAVARKFAKQGEQNADFINCVAFKHNAEYLVKFMKKGQAVVVVGEIQTRSYLNTQGQKVYITEILANEINGIGSGYQSNEPRVSANGRGSYTPSAYGGGNQQSFEELADISDNSLPF